MLKQFGLEVHLAKKGSLHRLTVSGCVIVLNGGALEAGLVVLPMVSVLPGLTEGALFTFALSKRLGAYHDTSRWTKQVAEATGGSERPPLGVAAKLALLTSGSGCRMCGLGCKGALSLGDVK